MANEPHVINVTMRNDKSLVFDKDVDLQDKNDITKVIFDYYDNFVQGHKINKTEIFYPSVFIKKYRILATYESGLWDTKIMEQLKKYADQLMEFKKTDMSKGVKDYIENRDNYIKDYRGKYVIFNNNGYKIIDKNELSYEEWKSYDCVSMKIGDEYETSSPLYPIHASGRYYEFNISRNPMAYSDRILVPISLTKKDDSILTVQNILIDTGAPRSSFNYSVLDDLGYDITSLPVNRITGVGRSNASILSQLNVSFFGIKHTLQQVQFFSMNSLEGIKGLIGMDLIQFVKIIIEGVNVYIWAEDENMQDPPQW